MFGARYVIKIKLALRRTYYLICVCNFPSITTQLLMRIFACQVVMSDSQWSEGVKSIFRTLLNKLSNICKSCSYARRIYINWREDSTLIFLNSILEEVAKSKFYHLYISQRYDFSPNLKVIAQKMSLPRP